MKKLSLLFSVLFMMVLAGNVFAYDKGRSASDSRGGFQDDRRDNKHRDEAPSSRKHQGGIVTQADQVANARDDAACRLEGRIIKKLGKERYLFQDASGTVTVKIDKDDFHGRTVKPSNIVRLRGEVDHSSKRGNEVDVDYVEVVK